MNPYLIAFVAFVFGIAAGLMLAWWSDPVRSSSGFQAIACPLCGGQGHTHLRTASGAPQGCGYCRGQGKVIVSPKP